MCSACPCTMFLVGRGAGYPLNSCSSSHPDKDAGLCYKSCNSGKERGCSTFQQHCFVTMGHHKSKHSCGTQCLLASLHLSFSGCLACPLQATQAMGRCAGRSAPRVRDKGCRVLVLREPWLRAAVQCCAARVQTHSAGLYVVQAMTTRGPSAPSTATPTARDAAVTGGSAATAATTAVRATPIVS